MQITLLPGCSTVSLLLFDCTTILPLNSIILMDNGFMVGSVEHRNPKHSSNDATCLELGWSSISWQLSHKRFGEDRLLCLMSPSLSGTMNKCQGSCPVTSSRTKSMGPTDEAPLYGAAAHYLMQVYHDAGYINTIGK